MTSSPVLSDPAVTGSPSSSASSPRLRSTIEINDCYQPIAPQKRTVTLQWKDLSVSTLPSKNTPGKMLLKPCSGMMNGGFWGILGVSGCGKTTFLSALALRLDTKRRNVTGKLLLNGQEYCKSTLKSMSGYVMQDDLLNAHLTVS